MSAADGVIRWSVIHRHVRRLVQSVTGRNLDELRDQHVQMASADEWICVFDARSGGRAKAVFETRDRAIEFAEHHASALTPAGTPLKWEDAETAAVSTTQLGNYLVARQPVRAPRRHASRPGDRHGRPRQVA
jgi:hypothetical protein